MDRSVAVVEEYLRSLVDHDWEGLSGTLAPDVVRRGPYLDDFQGAEAYVAMLSSTLPALVDYELEVARVWGDGEGRVCAELSETVTINGARLLNLRSGVIEHYRASFILTNPKLLELDANTIGIRRQQVIGDAYRERAELAEDQIGRAHV